MSSSSTGFCIRQSVFCVVAVVTVLTVGDIAGTMANAPDDLPGPSITTQTDHAIQSKQATQPSSAAQVDKSAQPTKSAKAATKPTIAKPAKKSATDKPAKKSATAGPEQAPSVGEPLAAGMVKLLQDEIVAGIRQRGITDRFARFQSYAAGRVGATAGKYTGSELTGNCRLRWYNHMMQNMLAAPAEAERFTRKLHLAALDNHEGLARILAIAADKMDAGQRKPRKSPPVTSAAKRWR